ncbi:Uncharacterised protein [Mycobacteroides abscessus subsp. abscessus]|nr:Uncharacterised protein [Mycobacteroides abscessus subsp. abscessus]
MHDGGGNRIGPQGQATHAGIVPVSGQLTHQPTDQSPGTVMQRGAAQVDVVVGLLTRRQRHLAVHHRDIADQGRQLVAIGRIEIRS